MIKEKLNQLMNLMKFHIIMKVLGALTFFVLIIFACVATYYANTSVLWMIFKTIIMLLAVSGSAEIARKLTKNTYRHEESKYVLILIACMLLPSSLFIYDLQFRYVSRSMSEYAWRLDNTSNEWIFMDTFLYKTTMFEEVQWRIRDEDHHVAVVIKEGDFNVHIQVDAHVSSETWASAEVSFDPEKLQTFLEKDISRTIANNFELCKMENLQGFSKNFYYEGTRLDRADLR